MTQIQSRLSLFVCMRVYVSVTNDKLVNKPLHTCLKKLKAFYSTLLKCWNAAYPGMLLCKAFQFLQNYWSAFKIQPLSTLLVKAFKTWTLFHVRIPRTPFFVAPQRSTFIPYSCVRWKNWVVCRDEIVTVCGSSKTMEFVPVPFCFLSRLLSSITKSLSITLSLFTWNRSLFCTLQRSSVAVMTVLEWRCL